MCSQCTQTGTKKRYNWVYNIGCVVATNFTACFAVTFNHFFQISKTLCPDAKFFTIIREPSEVYLSMFEYFDLKQVTCL